MKRSTEQAIRDGLATADKAVAKAEAKQQAASAKTEAAASASIGAQIALDQARDRRDRLVTALDALVSQPTLALVDPPTADPADNPAPTEPVEAEAPNRAIARDR